MEDNGACNMRTMELKDKYEKYLNGVDEDETPMTLDEFLIHLASREYKD